MFAAYSDTLPFGLGTESENRRSKADKSCDLWYHGNCRKVITKGSMARLNQIKKGESLYMMTDAEKLILEKLDLLGLEVREAKEAAARAEAAANRAEETAAKAEAAANRAEETAARAEAAANRAEETAARAEAAANRAEETAVRAEAAARCAEETASRAERTAMEAVKEVKEVQLTLENEISRKIDIIGEGHDFLNNHFNEACLKIKQREMMELEVINLRMEVKKIKDHLNIA